MSENDEEFVTKALNAHGVFFKKAVRTHLEGLNVKILGEEYPIRFPDSASIDLLAAIKVQGTLVIMPIECKRAYAARKEWVFFQDPDKKTRFGYVFRGYRCDSLSIDPSSDYVGFGRDLVCVEGVEIDQDKRSQPLKAASPDRIWQAAHQVCTQTLGIVLQEAEERRSHPKTVPPQATYVLPLIVTTAPLMICDLPADAVDLASGNHRDAVKLNPIDWLVLTYPYSGPEMPGIVCLGQDADEYVPPEQRSLQLKRGITIVNVAKLERLIGLLREHPFS